jgi:hypothetical protein
MLEIVEIIKPADQGRTTPFLCKAHEIEADLREIDEAIGDPRAVESFVVTATRNKPLGAQVTALKKGYRIVTANLPPQLRDLLPAGDTVNVSFQSPTQEGYHYLGRNHPFVEQLCQFIMANTLSRVNKSAARAAVIRTRQVTSKTTLMLFRCRNVIEQVKIGYQIVAEIMLLWGWRGTPQQKEFLDHDVAKKLLNEARAASDLSSPGAGQFSGKRIKTAVAIRRRISTGRRTAIQTPGRIASAL